MTDQAQAILQSVADECGYTTEQLTTPGRSKTLYEAKRTATERLAEQTRLTWVEIAEVMDCDLSTVAHRLGKK